MSQLRACDACSRHVFVHEKVCPFCNASLSEAPARSLGQRLRKGMSRAQLLALAAAMTGQTLGACTDTPERDGRPDGAGGEAGAMTSGGMDGAGEGGEGAGAGGDAGGMAGAGAGMGGGDAGDLGGADGGGAGGMGGGGAGGDDIGQPLYGAPVEDAAVDAGPDAGEEMVFPAYGASPDPNP